MNERAHAKFWDNYKIDTKVYYIFKTEDISTLYHRVIEYKKYRLQDSVQWLLSLNIRNCFIIVKFVEDSERSNEDGMG